MLRVRKHRNLCAWHFSIVRNVTFMKFWCMYIMVTHISTVRQSLCYVESANTWQIDTPLMLHLPVSGVQNYVQIMPNAKWLPQPRCCLNLTKVTLVTNTSRNVWVSTSPLYVIVVQFEFRQDNLVTKLSSTQSNKMILSFAVVSTQLTSNQYKAVDEYFHHNSSTVNLLWTVFLCRALTSDIKWAK